MLRPLREIRFDRNEWAGAFGDIGTDFPLIVGMILAGGLDSASALIMFGLMQVFSGIVYRLPMPVQPLKAMAAIVITQRLGGEVLYGGGLAIGLTMLFLNLSRLIDWLARVVPKAVIRGIQFGLGMKLALLALQDYAAAEGLGGYALAAVAFLITILLLGNRNYPPAILIIVLGIAYAFAFKIDRTAFASALGFGLPSLHTPSWGDVLTGFVLLALPQIPLSLGNSILATKQIAEDLFPQRRLTVRQITTTYSIMNLINPFFSGIPTCHGSGGMVGHYTFGGRTGGSVILYGLLYLGFGLFFSAGFDTVVHIFPLPVLGVLLLFEGLGLMVLVRDQVQPKADLVIALLVGVIAGGVRYGFVIGLFAGTLLFYLKEKGWTGIRNDDSGTGLA